MADAEHRAAETEATRKATGEARSLSASMPRLILEARRVAATVIHGLHGRRRAGTGENFWQFRRFVSGEPAARVDWRRSARDDHLYVREQEWEAAHTVWIWPDRSPSMVFASPLVWETKLDRALVIAFALAEVLVEGGERVGIPGLMRPTASRNIIEKMAEIMVHDAAARASLPPSFAPSPQSEVLVLSDLWSPIADVHNTIAQLSANGAQGHVVQIVDPAEETFPFSGRVEFFDPEDGHSITVGRAEAWREDYQKRLERHRAEIRAETDRLGWSFIIHRTDRPATELLLKLHAQMGQGPTAAPIAAAAAQRSERMIGGIPLGFAQPLVLLGLLSLPVLWWLLRLVPPRPRRRSFAPEKAAARHPAEGRDAGAHAVVADAAAPDARGAADLRRRRPVVESAARHLAGERAARAADRRRLGRGRHLGHAPAHRGRSDRARRDRQSRRRDHPAVRSRPRHLARDAGRRTGAAALAQAQAAHGRPQRGAAGDHALRRRDADDRGAVALRRRRCREGRGIRRRARQGAAGQGRHRGGKRRRAGACAGRRRQRRRRAHREGAARQSARQ